MESEFLVRMSGRAVPDPTAGLDRMCGPLCEAVLEVPGSAAVLDELARSNMLLVPLDRRGQWYRYHHLFRDLLLAELHRFEPDLIRSYSAGRPPGTCAMTCPRTLERSMAAGDADEGRRLAQA